MNATTRTTYRATTKAVHLNAGWRFLLMDAEGCLENHDGFPTREEALAEAARLNAEASK